MSAEVPDLGDMTADKLLRALSTGPAERTPATGQARGVTDWSMPHDHEAEALGTLRKSNVTLAVQVAGAF